MAGKIPLNTEEVNMGYIGVMKFSQIYLAKRTHIGKYCSTTKMNDISVWISRWIQLAD